jgi:thymidylate synthase (FAD)
MNEIKVLDKGYVRLVDHMGDDLSIVRAARVSYDADWRVGDDTSSDERLIKYLWKNKHTSPFESVNFTFEVKAPIFILRQWHRHRTWKYNEISGRYVELPEDFYVPRPEHIGTQSKDNKQVRDIEVDYYRSEIDFRLTDIKEYEQSCKIQFDFYKELLERGWPRELARTILPLSTYSRMFATVDLHNLLKFIQLRNHPHAQWEIQQYAKALLELIEPIVPVTISIFKGNI